MRILLIVVHPGSACGSADFNLGEAEAALGREALAEDLDAWTGPVAVIDGDLSSELRRRNYRDLGTAVEGMLERAAGAGHRSVRMRGDAEEEFDQAAAAAAIVADMQLAAGGWQVEVTGAWHDPDQLDGCVNSVVEVIERAGVPCVVRASALRQAVDPIPADGARGASPAP
ncbi:hypothetical protein [Methylorubrum extorquens]|uniref:Uncharacterized protein n=1 Tax=Methylorubrum extorquens DSM 13060 TaxID=882800 RepID=H1KPY5_METEX|nr:hypothetical protein [Methylorubrum extorquens]EHP90405.1 hypothetical protein MetexDRAFT_4698 [Methylorubrum extorquens DSM 13060]